MKISANEGYELTGLNPKSRYLKFRKTRHTTSSRIEPCLRLMNLCCRVTHSDKPLACDLASFARVRSKYELPLTSRSSSPSSAFYRSTPAQDMVDPLQLAARKHARRIAVNKNAQQHSRMIRRRSILPRPASPDVWWRPDRVVISPIDRQPSAFSAPGRARPRQAGVMANSTRRAPCRARATKIDGIRAPI